MLVARLLKVLIFHFSIATGSLVSDFESMSCESEKRSKCAIGYRKFIEFPSYKSKERSTLNSDSMSDEFPENLKGRIEEFTNGLGWITRLFQQEELLYSNSWPDYNSSLLELADRDAHKNDRKYIVEAVNKLFNLVMESGSLPDKIKALQAMDPLLNDETTEYLIKGNFIKLRNLSSAIEFLTVDRIKSIDKNADSAKAFLSKKYDLSGILEAFDSNIWFLLNQQRFYPVSLENFEKKHFLTGGIIEDRIVLRADVDIVLLFKSMDADYANYNAEMISQWYRHFVKRSPFEDSQLYNTLNGWKSINKSLSLEDPNFIANLLDVGLVNSNEGKRNYLLLFQEDLSEKLAGLEPADFGEIYSCFGLGLNIKVASNWVIMFQEVPREKHAELADYFVDLQTNPMLSNELVYLQQGLSYLNVSLLLRKDNNKFDIDYAKRFTQNFKTLELLDIIGKALIEGVKFDGKFFNRYLLENPNWNEAIEEHFHHYISHLMLESYQVLAKNLEEYLGIDEKTLEILSKCKSNLVSCTLDKVPRSLNSYLELVEKSSKEETSLITSLWIAIGGSIFNNESAGVAHQEDFVHYTQKGTIDNRFIEGPVFVGLSRAHFKDKSRETHEIEQFLYFEHLVYNYFPNLMRMNLEQGFQRILAKNPFSKVIKNLIIKNFKWFRLPFVIKGLRILKEEMLKYNPEIAVWLRLEEIPIMTLLKAIYKALNDFGSDLKLALVKRLFNAQLLLAGSA